MRITIFLCEIVVSETDRSIFGMLRFAFCMFDTSKKIYRPGMRSFIECGLTFLIGHRHPIPAHMKLISFPQKSTIVFRSLALSE